jgi:carbonic anhydrase/acetyltransferase-like protein (isoleucine patch superfamily)
MWTLLGHGCVLRACTIEPECLVGMGSVLEEGSYMEKGSILGANSVLPKGARIPAGQVRFYTIITLYHITLRYHPSHFTCVHIAADAPTRTQCLIVVPFFQVWGGSPARYIRDVDPVESTKFRPSAINYSRVARSHKDEFWLPNDNYKEAEKEKLPIGFTDTALSRFFFYQ